jgi:hypothetical protein
MMRIIRGTDRQTQGSTTNGWIAGHMYVDLRRAMTHEVKLWRYTRQPPYPPKTYDGTEIIVVYRGAIKLKLEKRGERKTVTLRFTASKGAPWIVLEPGITKQVMVVEAPAHGVTIRWQ